MELHFKTSSSNLNEPKQDTDPNSFPSLDILLSTLHEEYAAEHARTDRIDNKTIALLTIVLALITVYVPIFPFDALPNIYRSENCPLIVATSFFLLLGFCALALTIHCVKKLVKIYQPAQYNGINFEKLNSNDLLASSPLAKYQLEVIDHYQSVIMSNSDVNSRKAGDLSGQVKKIIIIFCLLSISSIGTLICSGL